MKSAKPAIFFDRDGILIEDIGYPHLPEHLVFVDGVISALSEIKNFDCFFFLITNQAGVARGYFDLDTVRSFHQLMEKQLWEKIGWKFDGIFVCPHYAKGTVEEYAVNCACRKPKVGLIEQACATKSVDLKVSVLIGDKSSDMQCALNAGMRGVYIPSRYDLDKELAQNGNILQIENVSQLGPLLKKFFF